MDKNVSLQEESVQSKPPTSKRKKCNPLSVIALLFAGLFFCFIAAFPLMFLFGVSPGENYEKKVRTEMPTWDDFINDYEKFPDTFEQHYNDYFPLRSKMLELYSYFEYKVFTSSIFPKTTSIGKNGWLFYESWGTRDAVSGAHMLTETQLETIYNGLMQKYETLQSLGKAYVVYLAAEKQMIYPEHDRLKNVSYTLIDQLQEYLEEKNCPVPFIYGKDYLISKKTNSNQLYFKYDTHWNLLGAHYGYEQVMEKVQELLPDKQIPIVRDFTLSTGKRSGDLATTLFLSDYLIETTPVPQYTYKPTYKGVSPITYVTSKTDSDLKVFIYGDSFAQSDYWGRSFAQSACETRILHNSKNFQVLLDNLGDCDVVIEECVQRVPTTLGRVFF